MYSVISIVIIIAAIFLVIFVLVQNSKGGGLAANFTSSGQNFGVRQTADFLEKSTWTLIVAIFVLCIVATASIPRASIQSNRSAFNEKLQNLPDPDARPEFPVMPTEGTTGGAAGSGEQTNPGQ